VIGEGQYLDALRPGEERFYAVEVGPGQKLYASATAIPPRGLDGDGVFVTRLITPSGEELDDVREVLRYDFLGQYGNIIAQGLRGPQTAAPGISSDVRPGRWLVGTAIEAGDLEPQEIPVELGIQVLDPNEPVGMAREPGRVREPPATPEKEEGSRLALPLTGGAGLLIGLLGGFTAFRRRA
jgi:hypothetical protein